MELKQEDRDYAFCNACGHDVFMYMILKPDGGTTVRYDVASDEMIYLGEPVEDKLMEKFSRGTQVLMCAKCGEYCYGADTLAEVQEQIAFDYSGIAYV
jgi:hypothetical protein